MSNEFDDVHDVLRGHIEAERQGDVAATMKLVSSNPLWLMHPVFEISGRGAVEELYRRTLPAPGHQALGDETILAIDDPDVTHWGDNFCIVEFAKAPDRYPLHRSLVLAIEFDEHAVSAERLYMLDQAVTEQVIGFFGPDFGEVPGVRRLQH